VPSIVHTRPPSLSCHSWSLIGPPTLSAHLCLRHRRQAASIMVQIFPDDRTTKCTLLEDSSPADEVAKCFGRRAQSVRMAPKASNARDIYM
jgi:hypothetical protein